VVSIRLFRVASVLASDTHKIYSFFWPGVNVLRLGDVAEIEAQMFSFAQKFNRKTELEFSTSAAILTNRC
jgi:hypothetical protein